MPVTSVDAPSSWDIESGPPKSGLGSNFSPDVLVSLTAPKPLAQHFRGRHFVGGRWVSPSSRHRTLSLVCITAGILRRGVAGVEDDVVHDRRLR